MIKKCTAVISLIIISALLSGTDCYGVAAAAGFYTGAGTVRKADVRRPEHSGTQSEHRGTQSEHRGSQPKHGGTQSGHQGTYMASGNVNHIPVILYHSIKYEKDNPARLPEKSFDLQMKWLKDNGYNTLGLNEFFDCITGKKAITEKSVLITFDDGYRDNYTTAYKILKKYGFKAAIFVITRHIGKGEFLTEQQLKEMSADGIDIQSHTVSHRKLDGQPYGKQYEELKKSREYLEKLTGRSVDFLSYPYGRYNKNTLRMAKELGYKLAFTADGKIAAAGCDPYKVSRINIGGFDDLMQFIKKLEYRTN